MSAAPPAESAPAATGTVSLANSAEVGRLLDASRGKALVVNIWATWCLPCIAELPVFSDFYQKRDPARVAFISLSADFSYSIDDTVRPFVKEHALPFPVHVLNFKDPDPTILARQLGVQDTKWDGTLPATFVFGPDGKLKEHWLEEVKPGELEEAVSALTGGTS